MTNGENLVKSNHFIKNIEQVIAISGNFYNKMLD